MGFVMIVITLDRSSVFYELPRSIPLFYQERICQDSWFKKEKKNHSLTITLLANGRGRERGVCGFLFQSYKCQHFTAGVGGSWAAPPASVQPVCTMKEVLTTALLREQWQVYLRCGPVNRGVHPWCLCSDKQDQSSAGCLFIYQIHQNENINRVSNIWQSPLFPPFFLLFI